MLTAIKALMLSNALKRTLGLKEAIALIPFIDLNECYVTSQYKRKRLAMLSNKSILNEISV